MNSILQRCLSQIFVITCLITVGSAGVAFAQVPSTLTHHGHLTSEGVPFEGQVGVVFRLYDIQSRLEVFSESFLDERAVFFQNGFYSVILGANRDNPFPDNLASAGPLELEVTIVDAGNELVLSPRQALTAVPYAFLAYGVNGGPVIANQIDIRLPNGKQLPVVNELGQWIGEPVDGGHIADNAISSTHVVDRSIEGLDIKAGQIGPNHLQPEAVTEPKIANLAVTTEKLYDGAVTALKIDKDAVQGFHVQDGSISSADIQNNSITATDVRNRGGVYAHKGDIYIQPASAPISTNSLQVVTASCNDANDLPLSGFCEATNAQVYLSAGSPADWNTDASAASFTCTYRNTSASSRTITASIACITVD